jgi:hypothetical protein
MSVPGSDCVTTKEQFATRAAANAKASALRRRGGSVRPYRCPLCQCIHLGNRRADNSKGRQRR